MVLNKSLSYKITFLFFLIYLIVSNILIPKAYADCIVDGIEFDIGGRAGSGVTAVDRSNPITLAEIKGWDATEDDVSTCDVSHLTDLVEAFRSQSSFNDDIGSWDTSSITNMRSMFFHATVFNQNIRNWSVGSSTTVTNMFISATAMINSYSGTSGFGNTPTISTFFNQSTNSAPMANAGSDQSVSSATSVTLDGTNSSDADNDSLTYSWTQTSGTTVTLSSTTVSQPTFTAPTAASTTTLIFSLIVTDTESANSSADTVTFIVNPLAPTAAFNQVKS